MLTYIILVLSKQMVPRGRVYRYPPARNVPDASIAGVPGGMLSVPYEMGGMPLRDASFSQPMPAGALATALANATPEQQRTVSFCACSVPYALSRWLLISLFSWSICVQVVYHFHFVIFI